MTLPPPDEKLRRVESVMGYFTDDEWVFVEKSFNVWKQMVLEIYLR